ncbi:alpha/beta hydrolase [Actinoplanes sp. SE50]|uniref:alpha/beta fold hydrolase n=1 Tax=unclassified Actinoplanes TaxID=2626549 RepID=UPI00023ECED1|nr:MULTISPECIES: alpha/beta hydrolase [unclassified Actinoplanes]AEV85502.1 alpha/beta hydrolase fold protein [Actinoplanes sp. SE50/110]ATO83895.1 alpha/beta hydrolase [Actinoplanes sp. SE50]SLM01305.1 alpha/beta hydrolase [Actinoplanes sp. SE50/110]
MRTVPLRSGTVEYDDSGGAGPVLVFLTGILVGATLWRHVVADLRADHRCVVLEVPLGAHRLPMNPDADLSSRGLAGLVAEFLDALDLRGVTLIGCDWGGAQLVAGYGLSSRLARLVLLPQESFDNFPPGLPGKALHQSSRIPGATFLALQTLRIRGLRRSPMNFGLMSKRPVPADIMDDWLRPSRTSRPIRRDLHRYLRTTRAAEYLDAAALLSTVDHPALVLWAPESRMMRAANGARLAEILPRGRLVEVPDAFTLIPEDQPTRCAAHLREFVATT